MTRFAIIATILIAAAGCDKASGLMGRTSAHNTDSVAVERLDLARRPQILFQVFGERADPRMVPLAAIVDGQLKPIELSAVGWKQFDVIYQRTNTEYPIYRDGLLAGTIRVRRPMWDKGTEQLYSLPGCKVLTPLSAVTLSTRARIGFTVEFLATTSGILPGAKVVSTNERGITRRAREISDSIAREAGIPNAALTSDAFRSIAINAGTTGAPTLIAWHLESSLTDSDSSAGNVAHLLIIADATAKGYVPTYRHTAREPLETAEFRRYVDHLDLSGDGIDEIILEAWTYGGDTYVSILGFQGGLWREIFRGPPSWCLDPRDE